jgi:uncharacterized protein
MEEVLITGGTGLVGQKLTELLLQKGYRVTILSRMNRISTKAHLMYARWNVEEQFLDEAALQRADYIIHLAGEGVADKRWTPKRKKEIVDSRIKSTELLVKKLQATQHKVKVFISASAIGWYGSLTGTEVLASNQYQEDLPAYTDFLGATCSAWEAASEPLKDMNIRLVKLRTGIVLSTKGGALQAFLKPMQIRMATILGSGEQIVSWIHINDLCNQYLFALEHLSANGVYNAVGMQPVSNKVLVLNAAKYFLQRFFLTIRVPAFVLKLVLGEMSIEVLKTNVVSSKKIIDAGYVFQFPTLEIALKNLLKDEK